MKIAVNARFIDKPYTGIGQYTINLLAALSDFDNENEYYLIVSDPKVKLPFEKSNFRKIVIPEVYFFPKGLAKTWWEQLQLSAYFRREKIDMAFYPYPAYPWGKKNFKTIVTIHDCIPWRDKRYQRGILTSLYNFMIAKTLKKNDCILTVSEFSKNEIASCFGIRKEKISVINNAAADIFQKKIPDSDKILEEMGLSHHNFFLYCGGYDPRKNVTGLIESFLKFSKSDRGIKLVLAGGKVLENGLYDAYNEIYDSGELIIKTGFLDQKKLAVLYQNCIAFIHLSTMEGFNIPMLEAAYSGAPLLLSDIAVHREIAEKCAVFIRTGNDAVEAMRNMLKTELRLKYQEKSKKMAQKYSWKKSAQKFYDLLYLKKN